MSSQGTLTYERVTVKFTLDQRIFDFFEPGAESLPFVPDAVLSLAATYQFSFAVLLAALPTDYVHLAVAPLVLALSMELVIFEHPNVLNSVRPYQVSKAVHFTVGPCPRVFFAVFPNICSFPVDISFQKLSLIQ